jgi:S-adenosylmethionine hydrolase
LLIECDDNYFIGPDNGVLSLALKGKEPGRIVHLSNSTYHLQPTSNTFHGRDIFAPVAGYLASGVAAAAFGERVESFVQLKLPEPERAVRRIRGEILYIDNFGNLFTNVGERDLTGWAREKLAVKLGDEIIRGLAPNYAAAAEGAIVALISSWGLLEIAAYKGSAQRRTGAKVGDKIELALAE